MRIYANQFKLKLPPHCNLLFDLLDWLKHFYCQQSKGSNVDNNNFITSCKHSLLYLIAASIVDKLYFSIIIVAYAYDL